MEVVHHIVGGSADAQVVGLFQQHLLLHQLRANLLGKEVHDHRIVRILRIPLLNLLARHLLHPDLGYHVAGGDEAAVPVGIDHRIGVGGCSALTGETGNQVDHHRHRGGGDDDDE
jgi:hypothetical protein